MTQRPGINLLPEEGREEESQHERKKRLTFAALAIVLIIGALTGASLVYGAYLRNTDNAYQDQIREDSKKLDGLKSTEILYRTVHSKLIRLQSLLAAYPRNSIILDDIASFTPNGVSLTSLAFDSTGKLSVSGIATGPATFGDFVNILKDPKTGGSKFSNVEIVSVSGGGKQGDYRFSLSMNKKGT